MDEAPADRERWFQRAELERAESRGTEPPQTTFEDLWPSETKGNGLVVRNNRRTGAAQGKGTLLQKAHCRLCGFPNDLTKIDHQGGSIDGNGAGGAITTGTATYTFPNGTVHTEAYGSQAYRTAAGCAFCFSKNSSAQRVLLTGGDPWNRTFPSGF